MRNPGYTHGISADIFTFGSGLSCLLLGLFFAQALREEGVVTVSDHDADMLGFSRYGGKTAAVHLFSMIVGVISTQIYLQAIFAAKDVREARNGAFLSAAVIPPIGILGIIVGLYLRAYHPEVATNPAQALPYFLQQTFPPVIAALFSAGILLIVLGTGSGLVLGVTTNIYNDFLRGRRGVTERLRPIHLIRLATDVVLVLASILVFTGLDSAILKWSHMSMGLRGSTVFAGLIILVLFKRSVGSTMLLGLLYCLPLVYIVLNL